LWGPNARGALLSALASLAIIGCGGGGGGGNGICSTCDEDLNIPSSARVVFPDGQNLTGQINYQGDVDWFRFRGIQSIFYTLQIEGFAPLPGVSPSLDLTGNGADLLAAQIVSIDGATQLLNSTGTDGGTLYNINPDGVGTSEGGLFLLGDSRIVWACPLTNDFYIMIRHRRSSTGIGAYNIRLASSQLMTILPGEPRSQSGARNVQLFDDDGLLLWGNWVSGEIQAGGFEFIESLGSLVFGLPLLTRSTGVLLPDNDEIENRLLHLHVGFPNVFAPQDSLNATDGDPPHPFVLEAVISSEARSVGGQADIRTSWQDAVIPLSDGTSVRVPLGVTVRDVDSGPGDAESISVQIALELKDAVSDSGRGIEAGDLSAELLRTFFGFPWYYDYHIQPDLALDAAPIAVSYQMGDQYQFFESNLSASPANVVLRDGSSLPEEEQRGLSVFGILYDSALRTFQVQTQTYFIQAQSVDPCPCFSNTVPPPFSTVLNPDYAPFARGACRTDHWGGLPR
jgi:hypothetical protein